MNESTQSSEDKEEAIEEECAEGKDSSGTQEEVLLGENFRGFLASLFVFLGHCLLLYCWMHLLIGLSVRLTVRDRYPFLAIAYYASPWLILALLALMLAVRARNVDAKKRLWGLLSVSLICFVTAHMTMWQSGPSVETKSQSSVKLLLWNIAYAKAGWENIVEEIKPHDADVIALVEVGGGWPTVIEPLRKAFPDYELRFVYHGILLVRGEMPFVQKGMLVRHGDYAFGRVSLGRVPEFDLVLVDVYAQPWLHRANALNSLDQLLLRQTKSPTVLLGDFNTPTDSVHLNFLRERGMTEAFESAGDGYHVTWPVGFPLLPLDQIWVQGMTPTNCELHDTELSDHRFVTVELQ